MSGIGIRNSSGKEIRRLSDSECISLKEMLKKMRDTYEEHPFNTEIVITFRGTKNHPAKYYTIKENEDFIVALGKSGEVHVDIKDAVNSLEKRFSEINGFCIAPFHNHRHATTFGYDDICALIDYNAMHEIFLDSHEFIFITWKTEVFSLLFEADKEKHRRKIDEIYDKICKNYKNDFLRLQEEYNELYERYENDCSELSERESLIHDQHYELAYAIKDEFWRDMNIENDFNILSARIPKSGIENYK